MKKLFIILFSAMCIQGCNRQTDSVSSNGFYIPKNIEECNIQLNKVLGKKAKEKLKSANEEDLREMAFGLYITWEWFENDSTRLAKYFKQFSLTNQDYPDREFLIALSYHRFINKQSFDITFESKKITEKRDAIERERNERIKADSINGIFIPYDLSSCFLELNKLLNDTIKRDIRNTQNAYLLFRKYDVELGGWMRDNWQLWGGDGGSRMQLYFQDRQIFEPKEMSMIILESYAKYLKGETFNSDEVIKTIHNQLTEFGFMEPIIFTPPEMPEEYLQFLKTRKINDIEPAPNERESTPTPSN